MDCCTYKCTNGENCPVRGLEQYKPTQLEFAGPEPVEPEEPELMFSGCLTVSIVLTIAAFAVGYWIGGI